MLTLISSYAELFHNQRVLEYLKNIPGMTWTPGVPKRLHGVTREQVTSMLMPNHKFAIPGVDKIEIVGAAPAAFDWREEKPACMVVRDQGNCGSCWAFSSVGPFSDNRCFSGKDATRVVYSEQYMVSCDNKRNLGCNGGYLDADMAFLKSTGVPTDACVSYKSGKDGVTRSCPTKCDNGDAITLFKATAYENVCTSEESIKNAITQGAIQTAFNVYSDFMYYTSGIYQHKSGYYEGGHAVTFVGYGEENGVKYWVVRNSWGEEWGEQGFFRMIRGKNECGIENDCYLPHA